MIRIVVNSDDFGMCHSVNTGIVRGFREGILKNTTLMAPAPWFEEAVALAKEHGIPVGVHLTTACDWNRMSYRPVTGARSLTRPDGTFYRSVAETRDHADPDDLEAELRAQIELVLDRGITPSHLDNHMQVIDEELVIRLCREYGIHGRRPLSQSHADCVYQFDSTPDVPGHSSSRPTAEKKPVLLNWLRSLTDGFYFVCGHLAVASDELASLASRDDPIWDWAQTYRAADLELFTDPEVMALVEERGIELCSFEEVDLEGNRTDR